MLKTHPWTAWLRGGRKNLVALAAVAASVTAASVRVEAQQRPDGLQTVIMKADANGSMTPVDIMSLPGQNRRGGFSLFAQEDLAGISLRLTGIMAYPLINAGGICPFANTSGDIFNSNCGSGNYFHITPQWGIGLADYPKVLAAFPGVATMRAPLGSRRRGGVRRSPRSCCASTRRTDSSVSSSPA